MSQHFICYYTRAKLLIGKTDYKNALINLNNAQLLKEHELKVYARRIECFLRMGLERRVIEELEGIKHLVSEVHNDPSQSKYFKQLYDLCLQASHSSQ